MCGLGLQIDNEEVGSGVISGCYAARAVGERFTLGTEALNQNGGTSQRFLAEREPRQTQREHATLTTAPSDDTAT